MFYDDICNNMRKAVKNTLINKFIKQHNLLYNFHSKKTVQITNFLSKYEKLFQIIYKTVNSFRSTLLNLLPGDILYEDKTKKNPDL